VRAVIDQCRIGIFLGKDFGEIPLARVNAEPGSLDVLNIQDVNGASVLELALHPVVLAVIANIEDFLEQMRGLKFTGSFVLLLKFREPHCPSENI
jgi:hypothetical protein